jgi:hypothetical protein
LYFLFIVLKHGLYGCTVRYPTSLLGLVCLQEKQNVQQEKAVDSMKKVSILTLGKEKYPLHSPLNKNF